MTTTRLGPPHRTSHRPAPLSFLLPLTLAALALLTGCATTLRLPESRPADYTMLLTVYPAEEGSRDPGPAFRPARYLIDPDGLLRAESGSGVTEPGFPPIARRLEPAQLDTLYALALDAAPTDAPAVPGPLVYEHPRLARVAVIELSANGATRAHEIPATEASPAAPLIRELARLSWLDR